MKKYFFEFLKPTVEESCCLRKKACLLKKIFTFGQVRLLF
ncbi:hypothetical protein HMPREF1981_03108 [Bacteroides pyogenes F0041]|uniref:Uncharacterized protein n=1 Tax=Bacteroides pyogenes F0041 TaxID=1321819 RepID=U2CC17_9BACE|nr:hypothetical protein HMPREF1981_03108 [Bacteroides pyogenes F0041]